VQYLWVNHENPAAIVMADLSAVTTSPYSIGHSTTWPRTRKLEMI
jgi:hypothetical protein